jgi:iron complex outermembrane receptor protein
MNPTTSRLTTLLGTASFLTLAGSLGAQAQQLAQGQMAQAAQEVPEQVLITGSLIHGTAAVGVPVTNLGPQDFSQTGALTTSDLFRSVPAFNVSPGPIAVQSGANVERATRVNLRGLDTGTAPRTLLMIDGMRFPGQGNGVCETDPSIIPSIALDRIDILADGASATYGSDAVSGVINIILKRAYDGAVTQLRYTTGDGGKARWQASQLWGRTWDGGDITLSYEWYDDAPVMGKSISKWTTDFTPWGLDNRIPLGSSIPGTVSTGAPFQPASNGLGTNGNLGNQCTNCFAIPHGTGNAFNPINGGIGPTAPFSGSTLNWTAFNSAANIGTNGTRNEFDPFTIAWYDAAQQRNAAVMTVDQRLTRNVSFYGSGFYSNRRAQVLQPSSIGGGAQDVLSIAVPTFNPYYPTGGAPTNLRVNYNTAIENPTYVNAYELATRYQGGLNIDLPGNWTGRIYYSHTYDSSFNHVTGQVNKNAVSAALGWTMAATAAAGTTPGIATWTKPATVPYLNLFCDPTRFQCNSSTTYNYVTPFRLIQEKYLINEKGANFDGPLFDLPGGTVKAAIGANFTTYHFSLVNILNDTAPSLVLPYLSDPESKQVWATFAQLNVPIFGDNNAIPGIRKLELEGSWRHDQYTDVGGTSNPKVAFTWMISEDAGLTVRGSWGTSFRAPVFGEVSPIANTAITAWDIPTAVFQSTNASIDISCTGGVPVAGSGAAKMFNAGFACGSHATGMGGISMNGGARASQDAGWRTFFNQEGQVLHPENATNWSIGVEFAPTTFLSGLDIQATWYQIKINGVLRGFGNPTTTAFNDPTRGFAYIVPSDVGCPASNNSQPTLCATFQNMVANMLTNAKSAVPPNAQTLIYWLNDGGTFNKGWNRLDGVDWTWSYDWDMGDIGAFNIGQTGTYYLHNESLTAPGGDVTDAIHTDVQLTNLNQFGVENAPRFKYRARLGWSNGPWSITGFMDYVSHFYHTQTSPPNVNNQCFSAGSTAGGGTFPCAINNYTTIQPSWYTFDLSAGYDTGDEPVNDYLKHIGIQFVVQNVTGVKPAFQYRIQAQGGNPAAHDILKSAEGRMYSLIVTKTW